MSAQADMGRIFYYLNWLTDDKILDMRNLKQIANNILKCI